MPEPQADPRLPETRRVALHALVAGVIITVLKFGVFFLTDSVTVLSDALESIINIAAAAMVLYMLWLANRPPDPEHPYGHGKAQILAVGLEGWLILFAGLFILVEAVGRIFGENPLNEAELLKGWWFLFGVGILSGLLALYVYHAGKQLENATLVADGKHLLTDAASTAAVLVGLLLVKWTGRPWLDPVIAILIAAFILGVSWRLLWQSMRDVLETVDPEDTARIHAILDEELAGGTIRGYHKVRYRHSGDFHWVDMHLQVAPDMTVSASHALATRIERRIEEALGQGNATAHVEPFGDIYNLPPALPPPPSAPDAPPPQAKPHDESTYPLKDETA